MRAPFLVAAIAFCTLLSSCSDDPVTSGGSTVPPTYRATLQSLDAHFEFACGGGANELYAMGRAILRYDGSLWSAMQLSPEIQGVIRSGTGFPGGGFAVMDDYLNLFVYENGVWTHHGESPWFFARLRGSGPDDLYGLGWDGAFHYDGTSWSPMQVAKAKEIRDITYDENGNPVLCGDYGRVDRFDGAQWTSTYLDSFTGYNSVAVTSAGRVFAADDARVYEVAGSAASPVLNGGIRYPLLRADGEKLFAAGRNPYGDGFVMARYDSGKWYAVGQNREAITDYWAGHGDVVAVGPRSFMWQGNSTGGHEVEPYPSRTALYDAVAVGDAIYAIGEGSYRYQDGTWTNLDKEYVTTLPAFGIHGLRPDDLYAVGMQMILHFDGQRWEWVNGGLGNRLTSVCVMPDGDVIAVGEGPVMVEFDGATWTDRTISLLPTWGFTDVLAIGRSVFVVGGNGVVGLRKAGRWYYTRVTDASLHGLWGTDESHVYALSTRPNEMWFYNGESWNPCRIEGPEVREMTAIWGTSRTNFFVLTNRGLLAHFNGRDWTIQERLLTGGMMTLAGNGRDVLAIGEPGSVRYRR